MDYNKENMAKAVGRSLPISTKQAIEICDFIRHKSVTNAKAILNDVLNEKKAIQFKRFNADMGHKKGIGPGRYPKKTSKEILRLLETAEANAQFKGLNTTNMVIKQLIANKAGKQWHFGRKRRRKMKRTHIEVIVEEKAKETKDKGKEKK